MNVESKILLLAMHSGVNPHRFISTYDMILKHFNGSVNSPDLVSYILQLHEEGTIDSKETIVLAFSFGSIIGDCDARRDQAPVATSNFDSMMLELGRKAGNKFIDN